MVWATSDLAVAIHAATHRMCTCGASFDDDHRPRIFEVVITESVPDPNNYTDTSVMALGGQVIREIDIAEQRIGP